MTESCGHATPHNATECRGPIIDFRFHQDDVLRILRTLHDAGNPLADSFRESLLPESQAELDANGFYANPYAWIRAGVRVLFRDPGALAISRTVVRLPDQPDWQPLNDRSPIILALDNGNEMEAYPIELKPL